MPRRGAGGVVDRDVERLPVLVEQLDAGDGPAVLVEGVDVADRGSVRTEDGAAAGVGRPGRRTRELAEADAGEIRGGSQGEHGVGQAEHHPARPRGHHHGPTDPHRDDDEPGQRQGARRPEAVDRRHQALGPPGAAAPEPPDDRHDAVDPQHPPRRAELDEEVESRSATRPGADQVHECAPGPPEALPERDVRPGVPRGQPGRQPQLVGVGRRITQACHQVDGRVLGTQLLEMTLEVLEQVVAVARLEVGQGCPDVAEVAVGIRGKRRCRHQLASRCSRADMVSAKPHQPLVCRSSRSLPALFSP